MGYLRTEPHQAVVSWFCLLIARSCMHDIMCILEFAELERPNRVLKRKLRATHRERSRVPRQTGDGACKDSGSGAVGVERICSDGKPEALSSFRAKGDLQEKFPRFNMCITAVLLYQYRHCRRPPWQKRNICDYHHSTRALTQTLVGMPCSDQCLDAVACEGSRIIRPTWLLYMERP